MDPAQLEAELLAVRGDIRDTMASIAKVEQAIDKVLGDKAAGWEHELAAQRKEKEQLRTKEEQLRRKEELLLTAKLQGGGAGGSGAGTSGVSGAVEGKLDQILQCVQGKNEQRFSFSGSKDGKSAAVTSALSMFELNALTPINAMPRFAPQLRSKHYVPFTAWGDSPNEELSSLALLQHFKQQLELFGEHLGVPGGFDVYDVRGDNKLGFRLDTPEGLLVFQGGADAVIAPYGAGWWFKQLRVVFDWKTPQAMANRSFMRHTRQAELEMLGALANSEHPALVVFTDGKDFVLLKPFDNMLLYAQTMSVSNALPAGIFSSDEVFRFIVHHLQAVASRNPGFSARSTPLGTFVSDELKRTMQPLKRIHDLLGEGGGLAEQLEGIKALPAEEQLGAAAEQIMAWRAANRDMFMMYT